MGRPAKATETKTGTIPKEDEKIRKETERKLKGKTDKIKPPRHLNQDQRKIFKDIVGELKESGVLGNVDVYILSVCAIAIDRIRKIESLVNEDPRLLKDSKLMSAREKYVKDLYRCCNELSLSPQARAKIGNLNLQAEKEDTLKIILEGGNVD